MFGGLILPHGDEDVGPSGTLSCLAQLCKQCAQGGCVGKPSFGRFGWQQAWGQHAGVVRPVGYVCVTAAEKTRSVLGCLGRLHTPLLQAQEAAQSLSCYRRVTKS